MGRENLVVIKGAGDLASGVAHRLWRAGFQIIMTEIPQPTVIRRTVAFAEAVYEGVVEIEGLRGRLVRDGEEAWQVASRDEVAVLVDPQAGVVNELRPQVVVDAIMAKTNVGTSMDQAPIVIALGPGFRAGRDAHAVIETMRGHYLGRVIFHGEALPNTGVPGEVGGYSSERVIRAPAEGKFQGLKRIGDWVQAGEVVATVEGVPVVSAIDGILRGMLHDGLRVTPGMKVGDVDPRAQREHCFTISDKARAIAGGVLEAILFFQNRRIISLSSP
ncbi:selenium-dependent molybdenum cofactor biosynthesis protein YqeB [Thermanaeromonas sp. C210]|uniref:selenium-dependent molybdenum cofactor biosynthesis protein YqeB n=1 Tax=Thermanaeromonas sp. C210 TaxID=2731925 RepID=UPI000E8421C1|nr:selenium-dependent molybdenum cofactor biosynthesis protein YqeB [Thermanaeromonas sp. C210]GFN22261.1 molybdenum hydroxylase [Thermanaeromonas sp. C210]HBT46620.1 EF2563 family selenium-dependent molybdenum hydroxylase system protein [Peptococcaceae bacterium]